MKLSDQTQASTRTCERNSFQFFIAGQVYYAIYQFSMGLMNGSYQ